jgi:Flp pilus assembly protein TadG
VEFAVVAPLLFLLVLGIVEVGRALMVQQILTNGAREGARKAVLPGATDTEAYQTIDGYLSNAGIQGYTRQVSPSPGGALAGTPIKVTVSVPYDNVSWLPSGALSWLGGKSLSTSVEMRKEEY